MHDAKWIPDSDAAKASSRYMFTLCWGAITWKLAKKIIIAEVIIELEFIALELANNEAECLKSFLQKFHWEQKSTPSVSMHCVW